jgi:putative sterol carrier protein
LPWRDRAERHDRFQRRQAGDLAATDHFRFTGAEPREATVAIRNGTIEVEQGIVGRPDLTITADSRTWLRFVSGEASLVWAIVRQKIRLKGALRLLAAFGRCFPS